LSQPRVILCRNSHARSICRTTSFVSGSCAYHWTRVACTLIADHKRGTLSTSSSSSRYVPSPFLVKPVDHQYTQYYLLCKEPMPMDVEFMVLLDDETRRCQCQFDLGNGAARGAFFAILLQNYCRFLRAPPLWSSRGRICRVFARRFLGTRMDAEADLHFSCSRLVHQNGRCLTAE
jgi:hypothetical protein